MKHTPQRMGHRALSVLITVGVLVAVILLNVGVTALSQRYLWQIDETITMYQNKTYGDMSMYTVTDALESLLAESAIPMVDKVNADRAERGEDPIKIEIIFCTDRDIINAYDLSRYIMYTALKLQNSFPNHIKVSFVNAAKNPSAVQKYKITSSSQIYASDVIFAFGTEFRVYAQRGFTISNDDQSDPWAYNGEKTFANAILAITRAEAPVAAFITNHGERVEDCTSFRALVEGAGYIVQDIDLEHDPIPADCRILICYDPQIDFHAFGNLGDSGVSEIEKLDSFLDEAYSFMLFVDDKTPDLPNLEEYMEEWGVTIARGQDAEGNTHNYHINDPVHRMDTAGHIPVGSYATLGPGASLTSDMRSVAYPAKVVFPNATAIKLSDSYAERYETDEDTGAEYHYGTYYRNTISRSLGDLFTASGEAVAYVGDEPYEVSVANHPFRLLTLTAEDRIANETNLLSSNDRSYVCVFASTEFASDEVLDSAAYGNTNVLLATLNTIGRELVRANINFKPYKDYVVNEDIFADNDPIPATVCLTVIPAAICFGLGIFVCVKRKYK